jgi:hypothetical protein
MDPEFLNIDNEHEHDETVTSLSIIQKGDVDLDLASKWMDYLLCTQGTDIFRMKGVLSISHSKHKFVYQGVHMIFNGEFGDMAWGPDEERESKLVFIGKNLDEAALKSGFASCAWSPELEEEKRKKLRFAVGDIVETRTSELGYEKGKIVGLMYRDESMPDGVMAPYRIELDNGTLTYAPFDNNAVIRKVE